ncbi:interleukin-12 subunit alpha [Embiotoca jacksoni]|uniref:interleukin-12 subunit alpha n=1 Tax=Embiotoca jacksoni TaxID=100190 RepID=UPI003703B381
MANFNIYLASCVLLLTLSWRTSTAVPLPTPITDNNAHCSSLFKSLLLNIPELLDSVLCYGITSDKVELRSETETVQACAPTLTRNTSCMVQRNSSFNESECQRNIMKDLAHYDAVIQSYLNSTLRSPEIEGALLGTTLGMIQSLRKNCSLNPNGENDSSEEDAAQMWGDNTFNNRHKMCKILRGFHIRTITINRVIGYISSGDHRK